jgi:hypothetical protein
MRVTQYDYSGIPQSVSYYDPIALKRTMRRIAVDLEPDMCEAGFPFCGPTMTKLDIRNFVWPGGPKPSDYGFQFIEGEYMKADEYDMFLNDPKEPVGKENWIIRQSQAGSYADRGIHR